eukprot:scaffold545_cov372-Pavlova_lutheri.AAC.33
MRGGPWVVSTIAVPRVGVGIALGRVHIDRMFVLPFGVPQGSLCGPPAQFLRFGTNGKRRGHLVPPLHAPFHPRRVHGVLLDPRRRRRALEMALEIDRFAPSGSSRVPPGPEPGRTRFKRPNRPIKPSLSNRTTRRGPTLAERRRATLEGIDIFPEKSYYVFGGRGKGLDGGSNFEPGPPPSTWVRSSGKGRERPGRSRPRQTD